MATVAIPAARPLVLEQEERRPAGVLASDGRVGRLLLIQLGNSLLNLLTLGIYSFWGRTRIRRYLLGTTRLYGEPLEYTGTGGELLRGALVVLFLVLLPLYALMLILDHVVLGYPLENEGTPGQALLLLGFLYLIGLANYRALRYRLSRTQWRGIRAGLTASGVGYANLAMAHAVLLVATLGLTKPLRDVALARRIYGTMRLGDRPVRFAPRLGAVFRPYIACWLLALPTLGLSFFWYVAARDRHFAESLGWEGLRFTFTAGGREVLALGLTNLLLVVGTLGFAQPVAMLRRMRFLCRHLDVAGSVDFAAVAQNQVAKPRHGEGLASALDADAF